MLPPDAHVDDLPIGPHARIDHRHVDRARRKAVGDLVQDHGRMADVLGGDGVGDVDDRRRRVEREDHALHGRHVRAADAEIRGERDDAHIFAIKFRHNSRTRLGLTLGFFFFAWPMSCPTPLSLPSLASATILGLSASSWRQRSTSSESSTA